jgi:hypothetical protein
MRSPRAAVALGGLVFSGKEQALAGEHVDLSSELPTVKPSRSTDATAQRPFLGIHFTCCQAYSRIYINQQLTAFEGRCPRCARLLTVRIDPDGSDARFFTVG